MKARFNVTGLHHPTFYRTLGGFVWWFGFGCLHVQWSHYTMWWMT